MKLRNVLLFICFILVLSLIGCANNEKVLFEISQGEKVITSGEEILFPDTLVGSSVAIEFTIKNTGTADLTFGSEGGVSIDGNGKDQFSIGKKPDTTIAAGGESTFSLIFSPTSTGLKTVTVKVSSEDGSSSFDFTLKGTGVRLAVYQVEGETLTFIKNGGSFTFPDIDVGGEGSSVYVDFIIKNESPTDVNLTGTPLVKIEGDGQFTVPLDPISPVPANGSVPFTLEFYTYSVEEYSATVNIENNSAVSPYTFTVYGKGTGHPEFHLYYYSEMEVYSGETIVDFGTVFENGSTSNSINFRITNNGTAPLEFTIPSFSPDNQGFSVDSFPSSPLKPDDNAEFFMVFDFIGPDNYGEKFANVTIETNDPDYETFTFSVTGYATSGGGYE